MSAPECLFVWRGQDCLLFQKKSRSVSEVIPFPEVTPVSCGLVWPCHLQSCGPLHKQVQVPSVLVAGAQPKEGGGAHAGPLPHR